MNFDFNEIKMDTVVKTAEKEAAVRTSVSESESGVVTKILDVSADGKIISLDNQNGAARVFGRVNFKVLYLNGDGETRGLDYLRTLRKLSKTIVYQADCMHKLPLLTLIRR